MFALQNSSVLFSNIPQMPTLAKYGIFQNPSISTIKKIPEIDLVYNELYQTIQLLRDTKCERFLDFLAGSKFQLTLRAAEWSSVEHVLKFRRGSLSKSSNLNTMCKEASIAVTPFSDPNKISETNNSDKARVISSEELSKCNNSNAVDQHVSNVGEECKKPPSIMLHFTSFKNISNQKLCKNGSLYVNPGGGVHLNRCNKSPYQGQKRGFKTQRQLKVEVNDGLLNRLAVYVFGDKKLESSLQTDTKAGKDEFGKDDGSKTADHKSISHLGGITFIKSFSDSMRIVFYCLGIYFLYDLYRTNTRRFTSTHVSQKVNVKFDDAKGMEEAKAELKCVVDYLRDPSRYMYLGGRLPSGVLLQGPPGTGKTLLARAVAGEADVEFFHVSGSEFDELLVGEGAKRVRNLFRAARDKAPAVIFIDELDGVGGRRVNNSLHPYANQTIIQLLAEMDGFVKNDKIVVIGATNRASDLDEALLRPGRFDLKIQLREPDIKGRREILKLHLSKVISKDVDIERIAKKTTGFSGADLENVVNQAALVAAALGSRYVTTEHLETAFEKILLGPALKSRVRTEQMNRMTAYHECGHAVVAHFTPNSNPPERVTIIPYGMSLGHTMVMPEEKYTHSKSEILAKIDVNLGGRAAEELIFGADKVTNGCQDDLNKATAIATEMVCNWGMSEKFGLRTLRKNNFKGINENEIGVTAGDEVDEEIKKIIQESYERAKKILKKHAREHKLLAETLLEKEILEADEIREILGPRREDDTVKE